MRKHRFAHEGRFWCTQRNLRRRVCYRPKVYRLRNAVSLIAGLQYDSKVHETPF